ncbi:unnamed protein product [Rotaria sp. Silwood2]|nr:unnamed protein product [Rotaria sp. Silwood2]CAF3396006.1 unnamed protein product [Rotaria sp. Silwood2]CAF4319096.1 unnamed protein product [Rotaria sp. Silwood2]CAF4626335.1 unnamed protein product [Rotaria sp. Silwood2]CAF4753847.1 unnamed protein product [Rotaria sp. Silwood2]
MLDYKIEYESISSLNLCRGRKGSPVCMFTDICLSKFPPLDDINYKYCFECNRYTLLTNQHCSLCQRCVKAERNHCNTCNVCHLPNQCITTTNKKEHSLTNKQKKKKRN